MYLIPSHNILSYLLLSRPYHAEEGKTVREVLQSLGTHIADNNNQPPHILLPLTLDHVTLYYRRFVQSFKDHRMHRPDDSITAALWDHSRSSLVIAGGRLGVWKNKGAIQSTKHTHESPVTAALYNSHFHQVCA